MSISRRLNFVSPVALVLLVGLACRGQAATNTWTGSAGADWFNTNNWSQGQVPSAGQDVVVPSAASANVLLTNSTANLASFTITNKTLTFTNWTTALIASNVTVQSGGMLTHATNTSATAGATNRVYVICTNFALEAGGTINVDSNGYAAGQGPGTGVQGLNASSGGGYGGKGGTDYQFVSVGATYGSTNAPVDPGSGGGYAGFGGNGGGAVRIEANGSVSINGTLTANGGDANWGRGGGGSGGSIYISCSTFTGGTNGLLRANGGSASAGPPWDQYMSGGGGGGRITVVYSSGGSWPGVRLSTSGGQGYANRDLANWPQRGAMMGTVFLSDAACLSNTLSGQLFTDVGLVISGIAAWAVDSLTVSNCSVMFAQTGFQLTVTNNLLITGTNGGLAMGPNSLLDCRGNITLTNGGALTVYSGMTNSSVDYGALVSVANDVRIGPGSWIYPYSQETNGGSALFRMSNLIVTTNAGFNANGKGYAVAQGPGKGVYGGNAGSGGGYGGKGGADYQLTSGGSAYGSTNAPVAPGSGGGYGGASYLYGGAYGGGAVRIEASGSATINGTLTANGEDPEYGREGGGSGGSIYITSATFEGGAPGVLRANGGSASNGDPWFTYMSGGGGGGRVAVWYKVPETIRAKILAGQMPRYVIVTNSCPAFGGTVSVTNGVGWTNAPSTNGAYPGSGIFMTYSLPAQTIITVR